MQPDVHDAVEIERTPAVEWICDRVAERMQQMAAKLKAKDKIIADLLRHAGIKAVCRSPRCRAEIISVFHQKSLRLEPYNADGTPHWNTCPDAESFRMELRDKDKPKETPNA
ncbi:MAG TPA: hypothetical protein VGG59_05950 [Acidobacteriaceae bacterium]|jgi:hypothetical protein